MLTVEQSQMLINLRSRMLANVEAGKPPHEGLTAEEYREALDAIRQNRSLAAAAGAAKKKKAEKKKDSGVPDTPLATNPKFAKFFNKNLD